MGASPKPSLPYRLFGIRPLLDVRGCLSCLGSTMIPSGVRMAALQTISSRHSLHPVTFAPIHWRVGPRLTCRVGDTRSRVYWTRRLLHQALTRRLTCRLQAIPLGLPLDPQRLIWSPNSSARSGIANANTKERASHYTASEPTMVRAASHYQAWLGQDHKRIR